VGTPPSLCGNLLNPGPPHPMHFPHASHMNQVGNQIFWFPTWFMWEPCGKCCPHGLETQSAPIYLLNCSNRRFGVVFEEYGLRAFCALCASRGIIKDTPDLGWGGLLPLDSPHPPSQPRERKLRSPAHSHTLNLGILRPARPACGGALLSATRKCRRIKGGGSPHPLLTTTARA